MFEYFQILWDTRDVTWGGGGGMRDVTDVNSIPSQKRSPGSLTVTLMIFEHFFDICLVDPGSIQESSGTIFKYF